MTRIDRVAALDVALRCARGHERPKCHGVLPYNLCQTNVAEGSRAAKRQARNVCNEPALRISSSGGTSDAGPAVTLARDCCRADATASTVPCTSE